MTGVIRVSREEAAIHGTPLHLSASMMSILQAPASVMHPEYYAAYGYKDQAWTGSCVFMETIAAMQRHAQRQGLPFLPLSGSALYNRYRESDLSTDAGAPIGSGLSYAQIFGTCRDAYWPDAQCTTTLSTPLSAEAIADSPLHRLGEFCYVGEGHDPGMAATLDLLIANGALIHFGEGDHGMVMMEYDDGFFFGPNSHGATNDALGGRFGVHKTEALPNCWNLYASFGVDFRNAGNDALSFARSMHAQAVEKLIAADTTVTKWKIYA